MLRLATIAFAALMIAGCQSKPTAEMSYSELKQYAGQLVDRCKKQVSTEAEMQACINQEATADEAKRRNGVETRRAIGVALAGAGESMQNATAANRGINCTSTPNSSWVGGPVSSVRTTCY